MWKQYWKLIRDPFLDPGAPFVSTPQHDEALARLVETIESGGRSATMSAAAGLGKSRVLAEALAVTREPSRRIARVASPADGASLFAGLAEELGQRIVPGCSRSHAWRVLLDAVRLCRWQRLQVVLAIDDCQDLSAGGHRLDTERLVHLDVHADSRLTVIRVCRLSDEEESTAEAWDLAIRLAPLTRSETERYLVDKLSAAGRSEPTFTPRAIHQLHLHSRGVPRGVDRLASLALMAAALRGLEIVTPDVIEGVSHECSPSPR